MSAPRCLFWFAVVAATVAMAPGCNSFGPKKLVPSHEGYNDAVQLTVAREVLKNIVRHRYLDPAQFIHVEAINASFSVGLTAQSGITGVGSGAAQGAVGGSVGYSESPTITFVPLRGAGLARSLESPLALEQALSRVVVSSRATRPVLALMLGSIGGAPDHAGVRGDAYLERVHALHRLLTQGATLRYFREFRPGQFATVSRDKLLARDLAEAASAGQHFYENEDGTISLGVLALAVGLRVPLPHEGQTKTDLELLGLTPGKPSYPVRSPELAYPNAVGVQRDTLWLVPRSAVNILELVSLNVDVPDEHLESGLAPQVDLMANFGSRIPLTIRHSTEEPSALYRIQHRGYWFYVDETDIQSKLLFNNAVYAFKSAVGAEAPDSAAPQIVLPVGGG